MDIFVARQPIFDVNQNVYGYELLYRSGIVNEYEGTDGSQASLSVIRNAFLMLGPAGACQAKESIYKFYARPPGGRSSSQSSSGSDSG